MINYSGDWHANVPLSSLIVRKHPECVLDQRDHSQLASEVKNFARAGVRGRQ